MICRVDRLITPIVPRPFPQPKRQLCTGDPYATLFQLLLLLALL
jgi:hypothetical protein